MGLIVQKFGGSSVANAEKVRNVAQIVTDTYRAGNNVVLLLLTLTKPSGGVLPKDLNVTAMLKLKSAISRALRKGDVFSRYSKSQYILMLSVRQFSDVEIITERLQKCFAAEQPPKGVRLQPKARELSPIV